ncbi:secreted aspartic proteinase [Ophiocordyceps sinensis CO18]|uniref:Secreted aspartic proteinase n=1 Tax=Ophiocordyceps sinensis (strain Co18 / CGMCC 3.14243) TaxID=911162 RepID=T5A8M2_OPHSC|nr:secreted aspartic proteinase [Ophiocordyceps sinensis CO18]
MAAPWLLVLLSVAACAQSRPEDAAGSGAVAPVADQAWGMGSLTVPMPVKRSRAGPRLDAGKREAGSAGADSDAPLVLAIEHRQVPGLAKRTNGPVLNQALQARSDVAYYTTLMFGNPQQAIQVLVDTGSSELWINPDCATSGPASEQAFCLGQVGKYRANNSRTSSTRGEKGRIRYGSGAVNFTYFTDDVGLPNSRAMKKVKYGVATTSTGVSSGILGIMAGSNVTTKYNNFIDELKIQGLTRSKSYSVALGLKGEGKGSIIFGGVDSSKWVGKLRAQPIIPPRKSPDRVPRFWVQLKSISHSAAGSRSRRRLRNSTMAVILDTGSTLSILPPSLAFIVIIPIFAYIRVPYREMIRQSNAGCYLGVMESDSLALLGDTFLRSAYAVFDIDGNKVLLAQYANCGESPKTAASRELPNMRGRCRQKDLAPSVRLTSEEGAEADADADADADNGLDDNNKKNTDNNNGQSAASGRLAASGIMGVAAAVGVAIVLAWGL